MKKLLMLALVAFTLVGCKSVNQTAYKATGVIAVAVDTARIGFDDYMAFQKANGTPVPLELQLQVKYAWVRYQAALTAVTDAGKAYQIAVASGATTAQLKDVLTIAAAELAAASQNFLNIVRTFNPSIVPAQ